MAEQYPKAHANNSSDMPPEDSTKEPAGCFGFMTKKEQKSDQDLVMSDLNTAKEIKEEKHTLMDELQRTHSNSSSSGEEEVEEGGERKRKKKKKKKGLKEAIKEKISGDKEGAENTEQKETCNIIPMDKCSTDEEGKKGILGKIKEKLPGQQHNKGEEDTQTPPVGEHPPGSDMHAKEKKGIIDKIKEKLPGHHKTNENHEVMN